MRKPYTVSPEIKAKHARILELWNDGLTQHEIAQDVGMSPQMVSYVLHNRYKVYDDGRSRRKRITPEMIETTRQMLPDHTHKAIAERLDISVTLLRYRIIRPYFEGAKCLSP